MKVLHVIQRYKPAPLTGSEAAMVVLCESLARQTNHEVVVVTSEAKLGEGFYDPRLARLPKRPETILNVKVFRLPVNWILACTYYLLNKLLCSLGIRNFERLRIQAFGPHLNGLERLIVRLKPDLLHVAPMPMSHLYATWKIAKKLRLPLVVTPTMHFEDPKFDNSLIYTILADSNMVIAHSHYEKKRLVKKGIAAKKIEVIPSSYLAKDDFKLRSTAKMRKHYNLGADPLVLFLGSKSYDKGTIDLVAVWPKVLAKVPKARLMIGGTLTRSFTTYKHGKDLGGIIELEYLDEATKQAALSACALLCVPSRSESFGMILLEAWAKGKPVIGGSAGATRELIAEGVNGYTVDFGDRAALVEKIVSVLTNPALATRLGQNGRQKAKQFTEKLIVEKTLAVYQKAAVDFPMHHTK